MDVTSVVFSDLWSYALAYLGLYVLAPAGGLVTALITGVLVVNVIFAGLGYASGNGSVRMMDLVIRALWLSAIFLIALYLQSHLDELVDQFNQSLEGLLAVLDRNARGSSERDSGRVIGYLGFLDEVTSKGNALTKLFLDRGVPLTTDQLSSWMGLMVMAGTVVPTSVAGGVILLSQVALRLLLVIGPVFLLFLLYRGTRGWFDAWVSVLLQLFLMTVILTVASRIVFSFWALACDIAIADPRLINVVRLFSVSVVALLFSIAIPFLAGRLSTNLRGAVQSVYLSAQRRIA
ncbi:type IV secretion system protein [Variovorax guangxiensis]|uniref:Type IV secretion system protein n=1 Tax=Variovorax guangxiensis TaxID=1775474 RepID=A0A502E1F6_9BURK|nr:type IV secretion system protein [Variovorax guangxiensis]RZL59863.1 MAG: hypothetical protein EOP75_00480 [Variovorax sp.]TPG27031.1 hypothetical protein EAH83_04640 [Variovorax ginsengisoli]TPG30759.1 hypothetical protein EAH82_04640 [Variovorax guangxiensis]